ncbi:MAG: hypothetical protein ACE5IY_08920 [bacterium]
MRMKLLERSSLVFALCVLFSIGELYAQFEDRFLDSRVHKNGKLWVGVTNFGQFGTDAGRGAVWPGTDIPGQEAQFINRGGMFFGGIVPADETTGPDLHAPGDLDTLCSEGPSAWSVVDFREMFPHFTDQRSAIVVRSTNPNSPFFSPNAVSEEDFIGTYTDTFLIADGFVFAPPKHQRALGIEVEEKSYQFSLTFAEDIVFFDLVIRNIGHNFIRNFYAGFFADNDMGVVGNVDQTDDASGFMEMNAAGEVVNTAWVVEPDGDEGLMAGVVGVRVLRPTAREGQVSFNWWMSDTEVSSKDDWGPVTVNVTTGDPNDRDPIGSPEIDSEKYILLSNGSFDPPQFDPVTKEFDTNIPAGSTPNDNSRFLISFGPLGSRDSLITDPNDPMSGQTVKIFAPGDSILFTYAVIGGEGNSDVARALGTFDPAAFVDLGVNAAIAGLMFDNPGFDTDGDGFAGEDLDGDGLLDTGDGVPDFRGPPPPPAPPLTVTPGDRTITLDWSAADPTSPGYDPTDKSLPLNFEDPFVADDPNTPENESVDFEGFRVLRSNTGVLGTFEILAEFDIAGNDFGRNTGLAFNYVDHVPNGKAFTYSVVSFDRGAPQIGLETLATSPLINATRLSASSRPSTKLDNRIWVEPNPYVQRSGFEDQSLNADVLIELFREIHFVNVPAKCTIRVYTVDGDLVQTILHDNPNDSRARWNLISRNSRPIASGIYLFSVEAPDGDRQIGRFVVIK